MSRLFTLLFFVAILLFTGCIKESKPKTYENVKGVVETADGLPVTDAEIHFRNYFKPGGFLVQELEDTLGIAVDVPVRTKYTASLFRHGAVTPFATFLEDTLETGHQIIEMPDSLLTNGMYGYEITFNDRVLTANLFVVSRPDSALINVMPYDYTNQMGEFELNADHLALGRTFRSSASGGFEVRDSLQILIERNNEIVHTERVQVVPDQENFFAIKLAN